MRSFIHWGQGREKDFGILLPMLPEDIDTLAVPFLGNGDILLNAKAKAFTAGDRCDELIDIWRFVSRPQPILIEMLSTLADLWDHLPDYCKGLHDRLYNVYDSLVMGAWDDYLSLSSAVGRVTDELRLPEFLTSCLKGWKTEDYCMELRHQLIAALEAAKHLGMKNGDKFEKRMHCAEMTALYEYLVFLYNTPDVRPRVKAAILLWAQSCAKNHRFQKDDSDSYSPDFSLEMADTADFRLQVKVLENSRFFTRMKSTALYKKDALVLLNCEQPGKRDFIFVDPPCLYGKRKKKGRMFTRDEQNRLADFLLNKTSARWMIILPQIDPVADRYIDAGMKTMALNDELIIWNY